MNVVTIREYGQLTVCPPDLTVCPPDLDHGAISATAFDFLCELNERLVGDDNPPLVQTEGRTSLRLANLVGVLETPCGTRIEILPKHVDDASDAAPARALLRRMLLDALDLDPRESDEASLELYRVPLTEWVMGRFLQALQRLVRRGIRFEYVRLEEEQRFLRGQWDVARQLRQPAGREHIFQIRHDVFLPDRPENRLLRAAIDRICRATTHPENWRLSHELAILLSSIGASRNVPGDFAAWRDDRMMAGYRAVKPWCRLVLGQEMPLAIQGSTRGLSMLFPMEQVFERHVTARLQRLVRPGVRLRPQARQEHLCKHQGEFMFLLKPDLVFERSGDRRGALCVMDAKWKRLDSANRQKNYNIKSADMYQLYAYGQKYLGGKGALALIYPKTANFAAPLPVFTFSETLSLWALPFDLEAGRLLLPADAGSDFGDILGDVA